MFVERLIVPVRRIVFALFNEHLSQDGLAFCIVGIDGDGAFQSLTGAQAVAFGQCQPGQPCRHQRIVWIEFQRLTESRRIGDAPPPRRI